MATILWRDTPPQARPWPSRDRAALEAAVASVGGDYILEAGEGHALEVVRHEYDVVRIALVLTNWGAMLEAARAGVPLALLAPSCSPWLLGRVVAGLLEEWNLAN